MAREISKTYEPNEIEKRWAQKWVDDALFRADASAPGPVFSIVIPPPNVTGSIHIGHMLEHTQIDTLVRWHRMRGHNTLWLPGMDHAGIATQVVVERLLAAEGLSRKQMGREEFERRVWEWKATSGGTIKKQLIRLGASCDWSRERFTLDPPLYRAVLEAFLRLYREGLIYRGRYMVNWCPRCMTALSDLETVHQERQGHLWFIRYPVVGSSDSIVVATTRPETMLGDTAVAVHPEDDRYKRFIGRKVLLPLMEREIPVIADAMVDREFGTGAVKVTPAHDPNDFELSKRHNLPEVDILNDDGTLTAAAGTYAGLERFAARKEVVAALTAQGLLEKTVNHTHSVGVCDRCKTVVEPRVSTQWFCKMQPLAKEAIQVVREGLIPVVPENQRTIYLNWMENIRDWCISRQLWWGHRIPIWHCADCKGMTPAADSRVEIVNGRAQAAGVPKKCSGCGSANIAQDPDVLDTWFSSGLWPFSTLGWPDETEDLKKFYPTSLLISGYDILFFWDARMIMMALHLMPRDKIEERIPFRALYLHALVRDPEGLKMSKTRGNVVDPLEIIEKHGTDALRFALAVMAAPGTDIALSEERILSYRAFANKIWNATRFLFLSIQKYEEETSHPSSSWLKPFPHVGAGFPVPDQPNEMWNRLWSGVDTEVPDKWIVARLMKTVREANEALAEFRFHEASQSIYSFVWHDLCDWYVEWIKLQLSTSIEPWEKLAFIKRLTHVFEETLRLLHPFMPFISEEIWQQLPHTTQSIAVAPYPEFWQPPIMYSWAERQMAILQNAVLVVRNIRAEHKIDPKRKLAAQFKTSNQEVLKLFIDYKAWIQNLGRLSEFSPCPVELQQDGGVIRHTSQFDLRIEFGETVDLSAELSKLRKDIDYIAKDIEDKRKKLADQTFRSRAPENVVKSMESKLAERMVEHQKLSDRLRQLEKSASA
ncbi:MAG: valine--tRNA ligase [Acidobacteria bacterium]|nr:valine--tRNA ligase [Acidobacteriota bacterium]